MPLTHANTEREDVLATGRIIKLLDISLEETILSPPFLK
jgi:hypothetical protein